MAHVSTLDEKLPKGLVPKKTAKVWVEPVRGKYWVMYQMSRVEKAVRHRVCRTKVDALDVAYNFRKLVDSGVPGQGEGSMTCPE